MTTHEFVPRAFEWSAPRNEVSPDARSITGGLRSEVSELWYKAPFGVEHWYRFSTLIPEDTAAPTFRCVIAQWHAWHDFVVRAVVQDGGLP